MKRFFIILFFFLSFGAVNISAQSKKEVSVYEKAVIMINEGKYKEALPILKELIRNNKKYVEASWTLSDLYKKMEDPDKRISTLIYIAKPNMPKYYNTLYRLATAYHENCNYETAIETYKLITPDQNFYHQRTLPKIKECEIAMKLMQHPVPFKFKNMGTNINTQYDDYWPSLTADEQYFSTTINLNKLEGQSSFGRAVHEDIFLSKKVNSVWQKTQNVGNTMNTMSNEGAQSISLDGRYMFFVACNRDGGLGGCDIYYSIHEGDGWSQAINAGSPLNSKHWETCPSFSPTGDELYFASNRPGGSGKADIWKCKVQILPNGKLKFSEAVNLGKEVNSPEDELSPFIHADNQTLYFSSKGREGLGGYDVFVTYKTPEKKWTTPKNVGYPINTCQDEVGFIVNAAADKAYFSSDGQEDNGRGRDIYELQLTDGNLCPKKKMKFATGKIVDATTQQPIQATIDVFSIKTNEMVFRSVSDKETGEFITCTPSDEEYGVNVSKKGYMFFSDNFAEKEKMTIKTNNKKSNLGLDKIEVGKKMTLKNIFFDFDKATLKKESFFELNHVARFMRENPTVRIQLSGHTDYKGSEEYNMTLSQNRAKAAMDYLIKKGVPPQRMEYKGYGKTQPIADNSTEAGRAQNRRTEILIIGK
jgi:outer membrane protein OmpA-like peptidoglycan-associated protein